MTTGEWVDLVRRVFRPRAGDRALAFLVDLPDEHVADSSAWAMRRTMVASWRERLFEGRGELGLERVDLILFPNARRNNADLPPNGWTLAGDAEPVAHAGELEGPGEPFSALFERYAILIAPTQFSATAPLKLQARRHGFRAATMPGFSPAMVPALKLDWESVDRRCRELKAMLDRATAAELDLEAAGRRHRLSLDLRHRTATASGGLVTEPGTAGNLPSGETYIVPYEGERPDDASRSRGSLPVQIDGELMVCRVERNRVVDVEGDGPVAAAERREMETEPAYANLAELGLGVLASYGIRPAGETLLDEKLGLHVAFGRSDHFGGQVGAADFSAPERVVHIDRVYIREMQPAITVRAVDLRLEGEPVPLMRDGAYV